MLSQSRTWALQAQNLVTVQTLSLQKESIRQCCKLHRVIEALPAEGTTEQSWYLGALASFTEIPALFMGISSRLQSDQSDAAELGQQSLGGSDLSRAASPSRSWANKAAQAPAANSTQELLEETPCTKWSLWNKASLCHEAHHEAEELTSKGCSFFTE